MAGGVRLVAAEVVWPRARVSATEAAHTDAFHDRDELRGVAPLAQSDQQRQGTASALTGEVDLAGQAAPGATESLVAAVLRCCGAAGVTPVPGTRGDYLRTSAA